MIRMGHGSASSSKADLHGCLYCCCVRRGDVKGVVSALWGSQFLPEPVVFVRGSGHALPHGMVFLNMNNIGKRIQQGSTTSDSSVNLPHPLAGLLSPV